MITELDKTVCLHVYDYLSSDGEYLDTILYGEVVFDETQRFAVHERVYTSPLVKQEHQQTCFLTRSNRIYCTTELPTNMAITLHEWRWLRRHLFSPDELLAFRAIIQLGFKQNK